MASVEPLLFFIFCELALNARFVTGDSVKYFNSGMDNILFTEFVAFSTSAVNKLECATLCAQHGGCGVFTYEMLIKVCRGHDVTSVSTLQHYVQTGSSRTYSMYGKYI